MRVGVVAIGWARGRVGEWDWLQRGGRGRNVGMNGRFLGDAEAREL